MAQHHAPGYFFWKQQCLLPASHLEGVLFLSASHSLSQRWGERRTDRVQQNLRELGRGSWEWGGEVMSVIWEEGVQRRGFRETAAGQAPCEAWRGECWQPPGCVFSPRSRQQLSMFPICPHSLASGHQATQGRQLPCSPPFPVCASPPSSPPPSPALWSPHPLPPLSNTPLHPHQLRKRQVAVVLDAGWQGWVAGLGGLGLFANFHSLN